MRTYRYTNPLYTAYSLKIHVYAVKRALTHDIKPAPTPIQEATLRIPFHARALPKVSFLYFSIFFFFLFPSSLQLTCISQMVASDDNK